MLSCLLTNDQVNVQLQWSPCSMTQGFCAVCCRYLLGDKVSEADVRLFPTIFRFDHVYYLRFLLEKAMIVESYPNLKVCLAYPERCTCCCCF